MAGNAVELRGDDPDVLGALRRFNASGALHHTGVTEIVGQGVQVVHTARIGHELRPGAVFSHLFVHTVDVAQHGLGLHNILPVHDDLDAQHAVRGGMLRPQVQDETLVGGTLGQEVHAP